VRLATAVGSWLTRPGRRLPREEHTGRPWRIHEIAPDFTVADVWALRTPGGPGALPELVLQIVTTDFPQNAPAVVRFLWAVRWKLGAVLGWDRPDAGPSRRATSLRQRLPQDLRDLPPGLGFDERFTTLYQLEDEWAAEMANRTVHAVMHLGWVPDGNGGHRGQMAVLVKPDGLLGRAYMTAIEPFRYALVYPALLSGIERRWRSTHPA
jgi:hypothetical protein